MKKVLLNSMTVAALTLAATQQTVAQTVLYTNDYENQTVPVGELLNGKDDPGKTWRASNWAIDKNRVTRVSIQEDATHGKYVLLQQRNSLWAAGGGVMRFYDNEVATTETDRFQMVSNNISSYTVEFDAAIKETTSVYLKGGATLTLAGCNAEIGLIHSEAKLPARLDYGYCSGIEGNESDNIFYMKGNNDVELPAEETIPWTGANTKFTLFTDDQNLPRLDVPIDGTWCHYKFDIDRTTETVSYAITNESGTNVTGSYKLIEGSNTILQGIYVRVSSGDQEKNDWVGIDNIKVTNTSGTNGIKNVVAYGENADSAYYSLSGIKVVKPEKGVFIKNGKKIVIR